MSVVTPISLGRQLDPSQPVSEDGRRRRRLVLALGASLALAACGRKGPLELPPVEPGALDEPPSPLDPGAVEQSGDTEPSGDPGQSGDSVE